MKTFKFFAFLIVILTVSVALAALKISQYPNTASPAPGDYFILEDAGGTTNHNIRWGQICQLLANVTNSTITNLNVWEGYMSNLYVTNLYVDNFFAPTADLGDTIITNLYVSTNLYVTNQTFLNDTYTTNLYVETNLYVTNNAYINNEYVTNLYVTNGWITNLYSSNAYITNITANKFYAGDTIITNLTVVNGISNSVGSWGNLLYNSNGVYSATGATYTNDNGNPSITMPSVNTNAPGSLELATAGWVRSLFNSAGTILYNTTNSIGGTAFDNPTFSYSTNIPAPASRTYTSGVLTANSYFGSVMTTNKFMEIQGPIYVSTYMKSDGGPGNSVYRVHPEIYIVYDTNALATIGDWESAGQALVHGTVTNRYDWVIAVPRYVATNSTGFYLLRRYKVNSQTGTDAITIYVGTNTPSQISFQSPTVVGANWVGIGASDSTLAGSATVGTNLVMGGNTVYSYWTNTTSTNFVVDFGHAVEKFSLTNSVTLFSTTNRPANATNVMMTMLILNNYSGGNLIVNTNNILGWKVDGTVFPYTITNGDRGTFTFMAVGPYETNVLLGSKWFH